MRRIDSSFRDPDGYMFEFEGELYRAVNLSYKQSYDHLLSSGLYQRLVDLGLMVSFEEIDPTGMDISGLYKVLKPERIHFISYPYEWAFNMLKQAALLTIEIQKLALEYGMSLKDATAFNIQFQNGKPIFLDTLSFEIYPVNRPWIAYRQFCQHFLAPLALMARVDPGLNRMFILHIDGIPLELAVKLLPFRCHFNLGLFLHIYLHNKAQHSHSSKTVLFGKEIKNFPLGSLKTLLSGLKSTVENQRWNHSKSEWGDYTQVHLLEYTEFKTKIISRWLDKIKPLTVWDMGANIGTFSRIAAQKGSMVISFDSDPDCVRKNYSLVRKNKESNILPLLMDILNASPSIGWRGTERQSLDLRPKPDLIMALALIHHLAISANVSLDSIANYFSGLANDLIIEFVPKSDEKVQAMLKNREDIFPEYTIANFEKVFSNYYNIDDRINSFSNQRVFYLMTKKMKI